MSKRTVSFEDGATATIYDGMTSLHVADRDGRSVAVTLDETAAIDLAMALVGWLERRREARQAVVVPKREAHALPPPCAACEGSGRELSASGLHCQFCQGEGVERAGAM